jgi:large subunit ribosomal protein L6
MSRLGKMPIILPNGVEIKAAKDGSVAVKGPKGLLSLQLPRGIVLKIENGQIYLERDGTAALEDALYGLFRSLLRNCVVGVTEGFERRLSLVGVGYRAAVAGNKLDLQVGYSHPTAIEIPKDIQVTVDKGTLIIVRGMNKHEVGQFAAIVRSLKPPEPYKGKGIRYDDEFVRKKEGKAAKAAAK